MNLKQKLAAYNNLKAPQHVEKDLDLLKKKAPEHPVLKSTLKGDRFANEVLRALVDHVDSEKEIVDNRRKISRNPLLEFGVTIDRIKEHFKGFGVDSDDGAKEIAAAAITKLLPEIPEDIQKHIPGEIKDFTFELIQAWNQRHLVHESARKAALLHNTPKAEDRKVILDEIIEMVKDLPKEAQETMLKLPKSICEQMDNAAPASNEQKTDEGSGEKNEEVESLEEELEAKDETISEHEETIAEQKNEIENKEEEVAELEEKLEESEEVMEKLRVENSFMKCDLSTLSYPDKKKILFDLNLDEGLENLKADTITPVLQKKQDELLAASAGGQKKS